MLADTRSSLATNREPHNQFVTFTVSVSEKGQVCFLNVRRDKFSAEPVRQLVQIWEPAGKKEVEHMS